MKPLLTVLVVAFTLAAPVHADDVELKSGTKYTNLTLVKETSSAYIFLTLEGRRITLKKDTIASFEKKRTPRDDLDEREKALDAKDAQGLYELAMWAKEQGLAADWRPMLKKVLKLDDEHQGARDALGYRKLDDKWVSESEYERVIAKRREADYKARGWKKWKDDWVSPVAYARLKQGLVEHEGHWVSPDLKKKIDQDGWVWFEGEWVSPEDKAQMETGLRKFRGRWMPIEDLNLTHEEMTNPWELKGRGVEVHTNTPHAVGSKVPPIMAMEDIVAGLVKIFGEEPDTEGKEGPLLLLYAAGIKDYQGLGARYGNPDWAALHSSDFGAFYAPTVEKNRGGGVTYFWDDDFMRIWVGHATTHAFINRFKDESVLDSKLVEAVASYAGTCHEGLYQPNWWHYNRYLKPARLESLRATRGLDMLSRGDEQSVEHAGFLLHFFQQRAPEAFAQFMSGMLAGRGGTQELIQACGQTEGKLDEDALDAEFREFLKSYREAFKPWDK